MVSTRQPRKRKGTSHARARTRTPGIAERLLSEERRVAGVDLYGESVRLGELDSDGVLVGYIDQDGLAWPSLRDRIVILAGAALADALRQPMDDPTRATRLRAIMSSLPAELAPAAIREVALDLQTRELVRAAL